MTFYISNKQITIKTQDFYRWESVADIRLLMLNHHSQFRNYSFKAAHIFKIAPSYDSLCFLFLLSRECAWTMGVPTLEIKQFVLYCLQCLAPINSKNNILSTPYSFSICNYPLNYLLMWNQKFLFIEHITSIFWVATFRIKLHDTVFIVIK